MHIVQEEDELVELEVVLLPKPGLFLRIGQGHVELHVLDLPITQAAGQVIGLSTCDLPISDEGPPHCYGASEGSPLTGPPQAILFELHILGLILLHHNIPLGRSLHPFNH